MEANVQGLGDLGCYEAECRPDWSSLAERYVSLMLIYLSVSTVDPFSGCELCKPRVAMALLTLAQSCTMRKKLSTRIG